MMLRCGFIGLGAMGLPMASHLHQQQLLSVVGNRTFSKAQTFAGERAISAATTFNSFAECDLVMLCVSADADVLENVQGLASVLKAGAVVVDHSTVAVDTAKQAAKILSDHAIGFVDAPVSGGVEGARNGKLSVMAGGDQTDIDKVMPALQCYAARIARIGEVGSGQACKAVNQILVAGINEAVCEGLAFAERLGLDSEVLLPTLMAGAASNWFLDKRGVTMLRDQFTPGFKCAHMRKDLAIVQTMARELGMTTTVIDQALADYGSLTERGHGDADTSALILLKREKN